MWYVMIYMNPQQVFNKRIVWFMVLNSCLAQLRFKEEEKLEYYMWHVWCRGQWAWSGYHTGHGNFGGLCMTSNMISLVKYVMWAFCGHSTFPNRAPNIFESCMARLVVNVSRTKGCVYAGYVKICMTPQHVLKLYILWSMILNLWLA